MGNMTLPGPDRSYSLRLNLDLVEALEEKGGSILKVADRLVAQDLKLSEILPLLRLAYQKAGCEMPAEALGDFLLAHSPAALMADLLMAILTPLQAAGAVPPGEPPCRGL